MLQKCMTSSGEKLETALYFSVRTLVKDVVQTAVGFLSNLAFLLVRSSKNIGESIILVAISRKQEGRSRSSPSGIV